MKRVRPLLIALAAITAATAMPAAAEFKPIEMSIPFVSIGGIQDWKPFDDDTIYVQDSRRHWYRAELMAGCGRLRSTDRIAFLSRGSDSFDRSSSIIVDNQHCPVKSFVASGPPPEKQGRKNNRS